jgi:WD40 repeat protein
MEFMKHFKLMIYSLIRLVSNKYIVSCDESGKLKIWDLQTALKLDRKPNSTCLVKTIPPPRVPYVGELFVASIAADEFQIVVITQFDRRSFCLNVKNFLDAAK